MSLKPDAVASLSIADSRQSSVSTAQDSLAWYGPSKKTGQAAHHNGSSQSCLWSRSLLSLAGGIVHGAQLAQRRDRNPAAGTNVRLMARKSSSWEVSALRSDEME